jgi:hypothetical protein
MVSKKRLCAWSTQEVIYTGHIRVPEVATSPIQDLSLLILNALSRTIKETRMFPCHKMLRKTTVNRTVAVGRVNLPPHHLM